MARKNDRRFVQVNDYGLGNFGVRIFLLLKFLVRCVTILFFVFVLVIFVSVVDLF